MSRPTALELRALNAEMRGTFAANLQAASAREERESQARMRKRVRSTWPDILDREIDRCLCGQWRYRGDCPTAACWTNLETPTHKAAQPAA